MVKEQFLNPVTVQCAIPFYCIFCLSVDTENAASLTDSSKTRLTLTFGQENTFSSYLNLHVLSYV